MESVTDGVCSHAEFAPRTVNRLVSIALCVLGILSTRVAAAGTPITPIYVKAESGTLASFMVIGTDANAEGGQYITSQANEQGTATYQITVPQSDDYVIWCQVLSVDTGTDSVYVSMEAGVEDVYDTADNTWSANWQWTQLKGRTTGNPRIFSLATGGHTLRFRSREQGTKLDAFYITNDRTFIPTNGTPPPPPPPTGTNTQRVTLAWDPSGATNLAGYAIWYGTNSGRYIKSLDVGLNTAGTISNLLERGTYYFAVTAYSQDRIHSDPSQELTYTVPVNPPPARIAATPVSTSNGGMRITFQSATGYQYDLMATEDFRTWITVWRSPLSAANEWFSFVDTERPASGRRFYRVRIR